MQLAQTPKIPQTPRAVQTAIVVGAGMVGLCCAYALHLRGVKVTIVDADPAGDKASYGNAGALAKRFLPELDTQDGQQWMGHRPSTPDSLPVLGPSVKWQGLAYAFGHGHLGMTQAATSGQMLAQVLLEPEQGTDLSAYSIGRFNS